MAQALWNIVLYFLINLNMLLRVIALLGIYSKGMKTYVYTKTCVLMYSSFICNSQNLGTSQMFFSGCIVKLWYVHTVEYYYTVIKRNNLLIQPFEQS